MEFWGIEVKPGETVPCEPGDDFVVHLSQAALGETKKGSDGAVVSVKVDDKKLVLGTLSAEKYPQIQYDLVFEKKFELSNSSKTASVFFCGYKTLLPEPEGYFDSDSDEDEEEEAKNIPLVKATNGADAAGLKPKVLAKDANKGKVDDLDTDSESDSDSDECAEDAEDNELSDEDEEMSVDDSSDEEDESDEEEETPKKPETGKKRAAEIVLNTPAASGKKAKKTATPSGQKTGDKKGAHVATPHPAKKTVKTPANNDKSKEKSPKSGCSHACKSCSKTFNSEMALQSHAKAKHSAK